MTNENQLDTQLLSLLGITEPYVLLMCDKSWKRLLLQFGPGAIPRPALDRAFRGLWTINPKSRLLVPKLAVCYVDYAVHRIYRVTDWVSVPPRNNKNLTVIEGCLATEYKNLLGTSLRSVLGHVRGQPCVYVNS